MSHLTSPLDLEILGRAATRSSRLKKNFSGQSGFVGAAVAPPPEASGTPRVRTRVTRVAMSDLNVTAPPFAPPDSNRVDVPARDNHVAPHPPTPTRDIEGVRGDDDSVYDDPALATTVDAATRAAKENYELVRVLCQLLTSTRAQVARLKEKALAAARLLRLAPRACVDTCGIRGVRGQDWLRQKIVPLQRPGSHASSQECTRSQRGVLAGMCTACQPSPRLRSPDLRS